MCIVLAALVTPGCVARSELHQLSLEVRTPTALTTASGAQVHVVSQRGRSNSGGAFRVPDNVLRRRSEETLTVFSAEAFIFAGAGKRAVIVETSEGTSLIFLLPFSATPPLTAWTEYRDPDLAVIDVASGAGAVVHAFLDGRDPPGRPAEVPTGRMQLRYRIERVRTP